jgi:histidyl-tRNA synthetase
MERLILLLPEGRAAEQRPDVALIALGNDGWEYCVGLAHRLRAAGVSALMPLVERPMGAQLKRADKAAARYALFVGKDEIAAGRFGFKDMAIGEQRALDEESILALLEGSDVG